MKQYHKIKTVWKRDPNNNYKTLLSHNWACPEFEYLRWNLWDCYEKIDGTNIRVMYNRELESLAELIKDGEERLSMGDFKLEFRGKTDKAQIPSYLMDALKDIFTLKKMKNLFDETEVCLYGEGYGAKIQKGGGDYRPDQGFILFDVKIGNWWLKREDLEDIAQKLEIPIVPLIDRYHLETAIKACQGVGFMSQMRTTRPEGLVMKPIYEMFNRKGERIITKLKLKDFE